LSLLPAMTGTLRRDIRLNTTTRGRCKVSTSIRLLGAVTSQRPNRKRIDPGT